MLSANRLSSLQDTLPSGWPPDPHGWDGENKQITLKKHTDLKILFFAEEVAKEHHDLVDAPCAGEGEEHRHDDGLGGGHGSTV